MLQMLVNREDGEETDRNHQDEDRRRECPGGIRTEEPGRERRERADDGGRCLQAGRPDPHGVRAVLGAGTGLGMVFMVWTGKRYQVVPSEGGKMDFAPVNEVQSRLWSYLRHRLERVGCEQLLSGRGMERIYGFLSETDTLRMRTGGGIVAEGALSAADITAGVLDGSDPKAVSTVNLFLEIYGAVAGNLALMLLSHGGLYVAGGIAPRLAPLFPDSGFMRQFCAKGKFAELLRTIPVHVVMSPDVGLRGAVAVAAAKLGAA